MMYSLEAPLLRGDEMSPHPKGVGQASTATRPTAPRDGYGFNPKDIGQASTAARSSAHRTDTASPAPTGDAWRKTPWTLPVQIPSDVRRLLETLRADPSVGILEYGALHLTVARLPQYGGTYATATPHKPLDEAAQARALSAVRTLENMAAGMNPALARKLAGMARAMTG